MRFDYIYQGSWLYSKDYYCVVYRVMKKKYILSIDGNYDSDFDAAFYINLMYRYYEEKDFNCRIFFINSTKTIEENLQTLNDIAEYSKTDSNSVAFILGSLAEPIIGDLLDTQQVAQTFTKYEEIARVYATLSQKTPSVNILLIKNSINKELTEGFKKIDSMTISMGFHFDLMDVDSQTMMETYKKILEIIEKEGWEVPPFIN